MALVVKNPHVNAGDVNKCGFHPWVGKISWRRAWQCTPVFLPGESYGQRSLAEVHRVAKNQTWLKRLSMQSHYYTGCCYLQLAVGFQISMPLGKESWVYLIGVGDWRLISTFINESCKTCLLSKFTSGYNSCMDGEARKQRILNDWKLDNYWNISFSSKNVKSLKTYNTCYWFVKP